MQRVYHTPMVITNEQLLSRRSAIGSSDMAAILGLDPYRTPHAVWLEKTGRVEPEPSSQKAMIGTILEPSILKLVSEEIGRPIVPVHDPFAKGILKAHLDGMVDKAAFGQPIVEAKSSGLVDGWGEAGSDEIPDKVMVQVHHQMICSDSHEAFVGALLAKHGFTFSVYRIPYNPDLAEVIIHEAARFWEHVVQDTVPPEAASAIDLPILARMERESTTIVQIPADLVLEERRLKAIADAAEKEHQDAKARLVAALGTSEAGVADGGWSVTYRNVETNRLDSKALQTAYPDLVAQFTKPSSYRRLSIREKKQK